MASPAQMIQDAVVYYIVNASVPYIGAINTFVRDIPQVLEGDPSPCCIVVSLDERPALEAVKTNTSICIDYPVLVLLVKKTALAPKSDPWRKESRWILRKTLNRTFLLGGDGVVRRCKYNPQPDFSTNEATFPIGYKVSPQLFIYRTEEVRDP